MASKLTIRKLALMVASTAVAGAIHSGAQAAEPINCNSGLAQIAISSQEGGEGGIWPTYAHCVGGARAAFPATERAGVAGRPAVRPGSPGTQAARLDCNSGLTQIALASQQGSEGGIWPSYAHCMR